MGWLEDLFRTRHVQIGLKLEDVRKIVDMNEVGINFY